MSGYRNDLEAAQHRIAELEQQVQDLKSPNPTPPTPEPPKPPSSGGGGRKLILGFPVLIALFAGSCVVFQPVCGRACGAMTNSTEPAMKALLACPEAKEKLGDDVGWGVVGCSNCEGSGGGDPLNGGCHSSSDWQMPVSGSRGRGTYTWSFSAPPGKSTQFNGGRITLSTGDSIAIGPDGCRK